MPGSVAVNSNDADLDVTVPLGPLAIDVSGGVRSGGTPITWRTVRTTVPLVASRCWSQSSSASNVLGLTQPSLHRVSQTPWKVSCTQPPPTFSACVTWFCISASVISSAE